MPKFADSARYQIIAKTPATGAGAATRDGGRETPRRSASRSRCCTPFTDRFKLRTHVENQTATVYALIVDKGGPKAKIIRRHRSRQLQAGSRQSVDVRRRIDRIV